MDIVNFTLLDSGFCCISLDVLNFVLACIKLLGIHLILPSIIFKMDLLSRVNLVPSPSQHPSEDSTICPLQCMSFYSGQWND
jgi:hypothetical protein